MGWEERGNRSYYYRKRRIGDQVRSEYMGRGELGDLCAAEDRLERRARKAERDALRAAQQAEAEVDRRLAAHEQQLRALTEAALAAAGFRKHRGQWRKRRNGQQASTGEDA